MLKSYAVQVVLNPTKYADGTFAVWRRNTRKTIVLVGKSLTWGQLVYSGLAVCRDLELWAIQGFIERVQPNGWIVETGVPIL